MKLVKWSVEGGSWSGAVGGTSTCSVPGDRDGAIVGTTVASERGCRETSFTRDDPAGPAERFILVHFMTTKIMENRTTAITIGTTMAATLTLEPGSNNKWNREKNSCFKVWWFEGNHCSRKIRKKNYLYWIWLLRESGNCCNHCKKQRTNGFLSMSLCHSLHCHSIRREADHLLNFHL